MNVSKIVTGSLLQPIKSLLKPTCYAPMGRIMRRAVLGVKSYQDFSLGVHKY